LISTYPPATDRPLCEGPPNAKHRVGDPNSCRPDAQHCRGMAKPRRRAA